MKFSLLFLLLSFSCISAFALEPSPFSTELNELRGNTFEQKFYEQKLQKEKDREKLITAGKGIWINIWNYPKEPEKLMQKLNRYKIDTIYLQINRSTTNVFYNQSGLDATLKAAHQANIKVIGWSYCYLRNLELDVRKFVEPAQYSSPSGDKLDGMAADIEENTQLWSVKSYTEKIRKKLGEDYLLIAIVFSPRIRQHYPWEYIGENWDVLMPMTYWHGLKNRSETTVYNFVKDTIEQLRLFTKKENLHIHLITDGERTTPKEISTSLKAARDLNINAGISLYPEHLATESMLDEIRDF